MGAARAKGWGYRRKQQRHGHLRGGGRVVVHVVQLDRCAEPLAERGPKRVEVLGKQASIRQNEGAERTKRRQALQVVGKEVRVQNADLGVRRTGGRPDGQLHGVGIYGLAQRRELRPARHVHPDMGPELRPTGGRSRGPG
jgi:hypothetical protein